MTTDILEQITHSMKYPELRPANSGIFAMEKPKNSGVIDFNSFKKKRGQELKNLSAKQIESIPGGQLKKYSELADYILNSHHIYFEHSSIQDAGMSYTFVEPDSLQFKRQRVSGSALNEFQTAEDIQSNDHFGKSKDYYYMFDFTNHKNKPDELNLTITRIKEKDDNESKPVDFKTLTIYGSSDKKNKNITDLLIEVLKDNIFDGGPDGDGEPKDSHEEANLLIFPHSHKNAA